ncbi:hypothetical protein D1007_46457 [Hordeum vulgare]|nr:hypothetical protein D1007_46457 [Hordeum vulgare]
MSARPHALRPPPPAPALPRALLADPKMEALSDDSGWSSSDDSDVEELLQDDDVEMMGLLLDVQEFEDRAKLMEQSRGSKMAWAVLGYPTLGAQFTLACPGLVDVTSDE